MNTIFNRCSNTDMLNPWVFEDLVKNIVTIENPWERNQYDCSFDPKTRERFVKMRSHYVYENNLNVFHFHKVSRGETSIYLKHLGIALVDAKFLTQVKQTIVTSNNASVPLAQLDEEAMFAILSNNRVYQINPIEKQRFEYHFDINNLINYANFSKISANVPDTKGRKEFKAWIEDEFKRVELMNALAQIDLSSFTGHETRTAVTNKLDRYMSVEEFKQITQDHPILAAYLVHYRKLPNESISSKYSISGLAEYVKSAIRRLEDIREPIFHDYFLLGE